MGLFLTPLFRSFSLSVVFLSQCLAGRTRVCLRVSLTSFLLSFFNFIVIYLFLFKKAISESSLFLNHSLLSYSRFCVGLGHDRRK